MTMIKNGMRPIHPGERLRVEYLVPLGISVNALSAHLHVPATRLIVRESRGIKTDTALQLAAFFSGDASSWLNLQQNYDPKSVDRQVVQQIIKEVRPLESVIFPRG